MQVLDEDLFILEEYSEFFFNDIIENYENCIDLGKSCF